ncbi:fs(1)K10: DNA-binding protein K10 [Bienertia sinuspersici]
MYLPRVGSQRIRDNPEPPYGGYGPMRGGYGRIMVATMALAVEGLPEQIGGTNHIRVVSSLISAYSWEVL